MTAVDGTALEGGAALDRRAPMQAEAFRAAMRSLMDQKGPAVSVCDVWVQAKRDWADKEVQRTYTTTYIWMTNQLGHFTLGFLVTFMIGWVVVIVCGPIPREQFISGWMLAIPAAQLIIWVGKELLDYRNAKKETDGTAFPFDGWAVTYDVLTAVGFVLSGIVVSYLSFISLRAAVVVFFVGLLLALIPAKYWLSRKLCFQKAALPYLSRLADFKGGSFAQPQDVDRIVGFLSGQSVFRHLFVFGETGTGRTTLAVAIATERTFVVRSARYMSWSKFVENAQREPEPDVQDGMHIWPWRDSDIVILDDVVKAAGADSTSVQDIVKDLKRFPGVCQQLAARQTVWVLGPQPNGWATALGDALNVGRQECCEVQLMRWAGYQKPSVPFSRFSGA
jgi:hypothetical protein